jgi:hypothetical protein
MTDQRELWQLLAAPISAFNEAEAANAVRFVELLTEYACVEESSGEAPDSLSTTRVPRPRPRRFRELAFEIERRNELGAPERREIRIPLFQLIPVGGVSIERAKLSYALAVDALPPEAQEVDEGDRTLPRLAGSIARRTGSADGEGSGSVGAGNFEVEIELRQMDLPAGVLDLLQHTQGGVITVRPDGDSSGDDADEPDDDEGGGEEVWAPNELFRVAIPSLAERVLRPGEDFIALARIRLNHGLTRGAPVRFDIEGNPRNSLQIIAPSGPFTIEEDHQISLQISVSTLVARYKPGTRVGLRVTASIAGKETSQSEFIRLPHAT